MQRTFALLAALAGVGLGAAGCQSVLGLDDSAFAKKDLGLSCSDDVECLSGFCVDDVCCESECDGECQSCNVQEKQAGDDGVCGQVADWVDPSDACE